MRWGAWRRCSGRRFKQANNSNRRRGWKPRHKDMLAQLAIQEAEAVAAPSLKEILRDYDISQVIAAHDRAGLHGHARKATCGPSRKNCRGRGESWIASTSPRRTASVRSYGIFDVRRIFQRLHKVLRFFKQTYKRNISKKDGGWPPDE